MSINSLPLTEEDLRRLSSSYISREIVELAKLVRVDTAEGARIVGRKPNGESYEGIVFPYFWPESSEVREYRLRRDTPSFERRSDGSLKAIAKYLSPPGRKSMLYFVPNTPEVFLSDSSIPILLVEGEKKALALYRFIQEVKKTYFIIAVPGVWNWRGKIGITEDESGKRCSVKGTIPDLDKINWKSRNVTILFDKNVKTHESVFIARKKLAAELRVRGSKVGFVEIPEDSPENVNGIDDYIAICGSADTRKLLENVIPSLPSKATAGSASIVAQDVVMALSDELAYDSDMQLWRAYGINRPGVWEILSSEMLEKKVRDQLLSIFPNGFSWDYLASVMKLIRLDLAQVDWHPPTNLLPFANGVLDINTGILEPHSPEYKFTWSLPYSHDPWATCEPIDYWLLDTVGGNTEIADVLRAYLRAILLGAVDLQRFLELIGPGGTGKSTYIKLATALVGEENVFVTELKHLELNRFETSGIINKKLIVITDSERYGGSVTTLKSVTGQDLIRNEQKYKPVGQGIVNEALVIVAANEVVQSADYTSGLERRRLTIFLKNSVPIKEQRNLIEFRRGKVYGEFSEYLPGLVNTLLQMSDIEMTELVKNTSFNVKGLKKVQSQVILDTNPLADWFDAMVIYEPGLGDNGKVCSVKVGVAERNRDPQISGEYINSEKWLYPCYAQYCLSAGTRPVSLRRFSSLLEDLCCSQLKLKGVWKKRSAEGSSFTGLRLRSPEDTAQTPITLLSFSEGFYPDSQTVM